MRIWKWKLEPFFEDKKDLGYIVPHVQPIMPLDANVIRVGLDSHGRVCVWAEVEAGRGAYRREFIIYGTGFEFQPGKWIHHGSVMQGGHQLHVYERLATSLGLPVANGSDPGKG